VDKKARGKGGKRKAGRKIGKKKLKEEARRKMKK